ncbi:hypothetical protein [Aulosira sp. FACHB-615]|uniref:hypothetical protein n=1 Tax=Aulosira sp. FACHB-615 TaxID=2692777 RepID=UPI001682181D|nr:hypothetical protein [Aulosira sp. FACHB-615]MBD2492385.1 hypothetical protein [Aulosira sp. FACHB-615]
MLILKKLSTASLTLTIFSLNILSFGQTAKALDYECNTGKFLVVTNTNSQGQLVYTAFQGNYTERPDRSPDLILYNGQERYTNDGNSSVMRWSAAGGYVYQVSVDTIFGEPTGQLIVKRKGRVILRQKCADAGP